MKQKRQQNIIIMVIILLLVFLLVDLGLLFLSHKSPKSGGFSGGSSGGYSGAEEEETIVMGTYEQDNDLSNGTEPIKWKVLEKKDGKALVISCLALDCKEFNGENGNGNWVNSSLRTWLNSDFYESSFSDEEKGKIVLTEVGNPGTYAGYDASGCWIVSNTASEVGAVIEESGGHENTEDRIFLLSIDEVKQYFDSDEGRRAYLSKYGTEAFIKLGLEQAQSSIDADEDTIRARYEEAAEKYGEGFCSWWLRSPGTSQGAAVVDYDGNAGQSMAVTTKDGAVRPAMWITIQQEDQI